MEYKNIDSKSVRVHMIARAAMFVGIAWAIAFALRAPVAPFTTKNNNGGNN